MSLYNNLLAGTNLIHQIGCLDGGLTGSLSSLVMCDEIIGMIKQIGKGIQVTDETLALDILKEVGPGGEFLSHDHTYDHWKEWFRPTIIDRSNFEIWSDSGSKTYNDRLEPEVHHRFPDVVKAPRQAKKRGVGHLEKTRAEAGIYRHQRGDSVDGCVLGGEGRSQPLIGTRGRREPV